MAVKDDVKKVDEIKKARKGLGDLIENAIMYSEMRGLGSYEEQQRTEERYQLTINELNEREQELDERIHQIERKDARY